jgi:hypothetical protein
MKTNEFMSALREAPDNQLIFAEPDGRAVYGVYHLTELKAASFETIDCGGRSTAGRKRSCNFGSRPMRAMNT